VGFREPFGASPRERCRFGPEADRDADAGARERVTQVQRLRASLRSPADHADRVDSDECFTQKREEVSASGEHPLTGAGEVDVEEVEQLRVCGAHGSLLYAHPDDAYSDIPAL